MVSRIVNLEDEDGDVDDGGVDDGDGDDGEDDDARWFICSPIIPTIELPCCELIPSCLALSCTAAHTNKKQILTNWICETKAFFRMFTGTNVYGIG